MKRLGSRDLEKNPYTLDEGRILDYLQTVNPDVDTNGDPVGFLMLSHAEWRKTCNILKDTITHLTQEIDRE